MRTIASAAKVRVKSFFSCQPRIAPLWFCRGVAGMSVRAVACGVVGLLALLASPRLLHAFELLWQADGTPLVIRPAITKDPVEVLLWVRDNVTPDDEAWITDIIRDALAGWASIPTARIGFGVTSVRSATQPDRRPEQLLVVVANIADVTSGGSSPPADGYPGTWFGAVANWRDVCHPPCSSMTVIAAHELGHTLGLLHTTISNLPFDYTVPLPIMHFAVVPNFEFTPDDVAALSVAYPNPAAPLAHVTGTLSGRCVVDQPPPPPANGQEEDCERAVGTSARRYALGLDRCLRRCDSSYGRDSGAHCVNPATFDARTSQCIARETLAARALITGHCPLSSCPRCLDTEGNCDPDLGFDRWMTLVGARPLQREEDRESGMWRALTCNDGSSADQLTSREIRCRGNIAKNIQRGISEIVECERKCEGRRQAGHLGSGTNCIAGDRRSDVDLHACLTNVLNRRGEKIKCDAPECAGTFVASVSSFIVDAAAETFKFSTCDAPSPMPVTGMNIVAVSHTTGFPVVARLSGAAGPPGWFDVLGLPADTYDVRVLDGGSFRGSFPGLFPSDVQRYNIASRSLGPFTVAVGESVDVGDILLSVPPVSIDRISLGSDRQSNSGLDPGTGILPSATVGAGYEIWLHLRGGLHPLSRLEAVGFPQGFTARLATGSVFSAVEQGEYWIHINGIATAPGSFATVVRLRDSTGEVTAIAYSLQVVE
jgi:hypothetical protein